MPPQSPDAETTLSRAQVRTLALASLGGVLEFYDFVIFVFFAGTIGQLFFPPD
ncbi:MAG: MFS transporter, partial [Janthinobacterium lividum]